MSPSRRPGNARGKWQVAHVESFAGGVSVRPPIAAQGAASGHPRRSGNGAHRHAARQRDGMPSRAPRCDAAARWGHRALPQRDCTTAHDHGARGGAHGERARSAGTGDGAWRGGMATGHERGIRAWGTATGHERGARQRGTGRGEMQLAFQRGKTYN